MTASPRCPKCNQSIFHCPCPTASKDLQAAMEQHEGNTTRGTSIIPQAQTALAQTVRFDQIGGVPLPPIKPIRAKTYQPIAEGTCPRCRGVELQLRFCYNPYGDDDLICTNCADYQDSYFNEHGGNNQ